MEKSLVSKQGLRESIKAAQDALAETDYLRRADLGEVLARRYARECLDGIMAIARNAEIDPGVRLVAYKAIWEMGHGKPASIIRLPDPSPAPAMEDDIRKAEAASKALGELEAWGHLPPSEWPDHLRKLVGAVVEGEVDAEQPSPPLPPDSQ